MSFEADRKYTVETIPKYIAVLNKRKNLHVSLWSGGRPSLINARAANKTIGHKISSTKNIWNKKVGNSSKSLAPRTSDKISSKRTSGTKRLP